jgi:hypothetical protein
VQISRDGHSRVPEYLGDHLGTPFSSNKAAAVCLISWTRKRGRRALSVNLWKALYLFQPALAPSLEALETLPELVSTDATSSG